LAATWTFSSEAGQVLAISLIVGLSPLGAAAGASVAGAALSAAGAGAVAPHAASSTSDASSENRSKQTDLLHVVSPCVNMVVERVLRWHEG
jgi:hypothetical protein